MSEEAKRLRLFFALWPDGGTRAELDRIGRGLHAVCGGRRMRAAGLHLTLVFLGAVDAARVGALRAMAEGVKAPPFALRLDRAGCWRHNRVAWAGMAETPVPLSGLVNDLQRGLRAEGFPFDDRTGFTPHVTVLRNARCEGVSLPSLAPWRWEARDFVLVSSVTRDEGADYEVIGRWPLTG